MWGFGIDKQSIIGGGEPHTTSHGSSGSCSYVVVVAKQQFVQQ